MAIPRARVGPRRRVSGVSSTTARTRSRTRTGYCIAPREDSTPRSCATRRCTPRSWTRSSGRFARVCARRRSTPSPRRNSRRCSRCSPTTTPPRDSPSSSPSNRKTQSRRTPGKTFEEACDGTSGSCASVADCYCDASPRTDPREPIDVASRFASERNRDASSTKTRTRAISARSRSRPRRRRSTSNRRMRL